MNTQNWQAIGQQEKQDGRYTQELMSGRGAIPSLMPLDELAKQLDGARERVLQSVARVKQIADGLYGPNPEGNNKDTGSPNRMGKLGSLEDQGDQLHAALSELDNQLSRLVSLA